jgi:ABC-type multidrug transport system fused ATPase/permease subunit
MPVQLGPFAAFLAFVLLSSKQNTMLDTNTLFNSLSLLALISGPLNLTLTALPQLAAAVKSITRIEKFLRMDPWIDYRSALIDASDSVDSVQPLLEPKVYIDSPRIWIPEIPAETFPAVLEGYDSWSFCDKAAMIIQDGHFGWNNLSPTTLRHINLNIRWESLTVVVGPSGSGKSTLCMGLLGEVPVPGGLFQVCSTNIAFCAQNPWLMSTSIRGNILGSRRLDSDWYNTVLDACCLGQDLAQFPNGDEYQVGISGCNLSGGQKQRVVSVNINQ